MSEFITIHDGNSIKMVNIHHIVSIDVDYDGLSLIIDFTNGRPFVFKFGSGALLDSAYGELDCMLKTVGSVSVKDETQN